MSHIRNQSSLTFGQALVLSAAGLFTACSGEGADAGNTAPPAYVGSGNSFANQPAGDQNVATSQNVDNGATTGQQGTGDSQGTNGSQTNGGQVNEGGQDTSGGFDQNQNNAAQDQNQNDGSQNDQNNTGTGGAGGGAMVGTAGAGMVAAGGTGMVAAGGGSMTDPQDQGDQGNQDQGGQDQTPAGDGSCPADALFCEDFESFGVGAPNNAPWNSQGNLSIDGNEVANGARALLIQTEGNGNGYLTVNGFTPPGNSFFGRINVRVDDFPLAPDYAHFTLVELTGQGGGLVRPMGGQYIPGQGPGGTALWGMGNDQGASGDWTNWQPTAPTRSGQWICYEWEMDASDNIMNAWLDGVAQPGMSVSTNNHTGNGQFQFPQFNQISIGWWLYQGNNGSYDIRMDDIVLAPSRVGCGAN